MLFPKTLIFVHSFLSPGNRTKHPIQIPNRYLQDRLLPMPSHPQRMLCTDLEPGAQWWLHCHRHPSRFFHFIFKTRDAAQRAEGFPSMQKTTASISILKYTENRVILFPIHTISWAPVAWPKSPSLLLVTCGKEQNFLVRPLRMPQSDENPAQQHGKVRPSVLCNIYAM